MPADAFATMYERLFSDENLTELVDYRYADDTVVEGVSAHIINEIDEGRLGQQVISWSAVTFEIRTGALPDTPARGDSVIFRGFTWRVSSNPTQDERRELWLVKAYRE